MKKSILFPFALTAALLAGSAFSANAQRKDVSKPAPAANTEARPVDAKGQPAQKGLTQDKIDHAEDKSKGRAYSGKTSNTPDNAGAVSVDRQEKKTRSIRDSKVNNRKVRETKQSVKAQPAKKD